MMRRFVVAALCLLIQGTGLCYGLNQTIYINPANSSISLGGYAKKNTTVRWEVLDAGGSFEVSFTSRAPCQKTEYKDPLHAYAHHPAECKIRLPKGYKKGDVLHFKYQLVPLPRVPGGQQIFFQHVGSCDPCTDPGGPIGATTAVANAADTTRTGTAYLPVSYLEDLSCTSPYIQPDPSLKVNVGDNIYWENPSGANRPTWTIMFDDPTACTTAPTFKNPTCAVANKPSATPYAYHVVVGNGQAPNGCKFDGNIVISADPPL
jgi:hypothetical protein